MQTPAPIYLTTEDLMKRWKCSKWTAMKAMHWEGSEAVKIGKRLLITEERTQAFEKISIIHPTKIITKI